VTKFGLTVDAVDLFMLTEALGDNNRETTWWFHEATGDVRPSGDWADGFGDDDLEEQGWLPIEPTGGRAAFEDMEAFAAAVGDVRARDLLQRALQGKGPFRRFRDTLREFPTLKEPWQTWLAAREDARAVRWLMGGDHVDELDAEAHLKHLQSQAAEALATVRAAGTLTVETAQGPSQWAAITAALGRGESVTLTDQGRAVAVIAPYTDDAAV
jgi:hypothetical protein